jgi:hypothetical protein
MSEYPDHVQGDQLVYSNVEAEFSASNRRGFQVWLVSPKLREIQREIARRLEDFDWPTKDAANNFITERHCFFRTSSGLYVIARTVPLVERDVLNRAGRFHAHAVVLSAESMAKIHGNPFAVWDHFPFQDDPKAAIAQDLWTRDDPFSHSPIRVGQPKSTTTEPTLAFLQLFTRWLTVEDDTRPIALPVLPAKMMDFARSLFAVLPAGLRTGISLDSLSTGQSLNTLSYRLAGAYDPLTLRDWSYRRIYRLDVENGEFQQAPTPGDQPGLDHLCQCWLQDKGLAESDRTISYQLFKGLQKSNPGMLPELITDQALRIVSGAADVSTAFDLRITDRLRSDMPFPSLLKLIEAPLRDRIGSFSAESLPFVRQPLPVKLLAECLQVTAKVTPLSEEQSHEMEQWASLQLKTETDKGIQNTLGELFVIARRWGANRVGRVQELLLDPEWREFCSPWFLTWLSSHCEIMKQLLDPEVCEATIDALFRPVLQDPTVIDDAELLLVVNPDALPAVLQRRLKFVIALHRADYLSLQDVLGATGDRAPFINWVYGHLCEYGWASEYLLGNVDNGFHPGLMLRPVTGPPHLGVTLLDVCANDNQLRRRLMDWLLSTPPVGYTGVSSESQSVQRAVKAYEPRAWTKLTDIFADMTPAEFSFTLSSLIGDKFRVTTTHFRTDDGVWIGKIATSNGYEGERFSGVYEAAISAINRAPQLAAGFIHATLYGLTSR